MGYSLVTRTQKETLARNHQLRVRTCKEQYVPIHLGSIRSLPLKDVMHTEGVLRILTEEAHEARKLFTKCFTWNNF